MSEKVKQLEHEEIANQQKTFPLVVVCDYIRTPENIGMIFRSSEAFGVQKIYLCGTLIPPITSSKIRKTARSTEKMIPYEYAESTIEVVEALKADGYRVLGLDITNASKAVESIDIQSDERIAVVLGAERYGIGDEVLQLLDETVHINMFGSNTSINAAMALSISLFELTKKMKG